jgi:hypothetical protein
MALKIAPLLAVVATATGYAGANVAEIQLPAFLLMSLACLLGAVYPNGAWRRALMLGLSVPLAHVVARVTGAALPSPMEHQDQMTAFLALVPAFVGTYLGVGMRRLWMAQHKEHPRH